jgi:hypothetical protein
LPSSTGKKPAFDTGSLPQIRLSEVPDNVLAFAPPSSGARAFFIHPPKVTPLVILRPFCFSGAAKKVIPPFLRTATITGPEKSTPSAGG